MTPEPETVPSDTPLAVAPEGGAPVSVPDKGALIVGSSSERAQLVVEDPRVAPAHLAIARVKGGGYGVRELEGASGTRLNGRPASKARVAAGDTLSIGGVVLRLVPQEAASTDDGRGAVGIRPPERIGGFRVRRQLGRGSMGRVYLAVQESLGREVALKVLRTRLALDKEFVARFQAEARAAASLNHPNVVHVYDVGSDDGLHWLALEYMDRGSLEDRLRHQGPLPWPAVLGVLRDAADALEFAESKGLVHRDVKPANLMQNAAGATKLVDLGLATAAESDAAELGGAGRGEGRKIVGTAHFMAPEQARGEPLDHRADLYALGASAWRLLTARTPFEGANAREILRAARTTEPPPLREIVPDCPAAVERLVLELMAKDRDARPASASVLRERVEALAGGAAPAAGDRTTPRRSRKPIVAFVATVVLSAAAWFAWREYGPPSATPEPEPPTVVDPGDAAPAPPPDPLAGPDAPDTDAPDTDPAPSDPAATGPSAPDGPIGSEDAALAQLEQAARRRLDVVRAIGDPQGRELALRTFVVEHAGTSAATEATRLADALAARGPVGPALGADLAAAAERAIADLEETLRAPDGTWLRPAEWRLVVDAWEPPSALAGSTELAAAELALEDRADRDFRAAHREQMDAAWEQIDAGEFEAAGATLEALHDWHAPAEAPEDDESASAAGPTPDDVVGIGGGAGAPDQALPRTREELTTMLATGTVRPGEPYPTLAADVRALQASLPELRELWAAAMEERDRARAAAELVADGSLAALLAGARYADAAERLDAFAATCRSTVVGAEAASFADWLREAQQAREVLIETRSGEGWLRQSVPIPNEHRGIGEAVSVSADGIAVDTGGARRQIPWTEYASDVTSLAPLFNRRVSREWGPEEREAIVAWMRIAGVLAALAELRPVLEGVGRLSDVERDDALESLAAARDWSADGPETERERAAVARVAGALRAVDRGDWPSVAHQLETLFERHRDALTTWLLSDGTPTTEPTAWPVERDAYGAAHLSAPPTGDGAAADGSHEVAEPPLEDGTDDPEADDPEPDGPEADSGG